AGDGASHVGDELVPRDGHAVLVQEGRGRDSGAGGRRRMNKVNVSEPVAWVHGIETSHRRTKSGEVSSSHNYGTNIFVHRNDRCLMVFHPVVAIPEKHFSKRVI